MEPQSEPRSRLLPPDPAAIRAARVTPRRPKARGLPILGVALIAGMGLALVGPGSAGSKEAAEPPPAATGLLEIDANGPRSEVVVVVRWSGDPGAATQTRAEAARHAVVAWLKGHSPAELAAAPGDPSRDSLRAAVGAALFPDGRGTIDDLALRSLRVR